MKVVWDAIKQFKRLSHGVGEQLDTPQTWAQNADSDATCAQDGVKLDALAEERGFPAVAALLKATGSNFTTGPGKKSFETFKGPCTTQVPNCPQVNHKNLSSIPA